MNLMVDAVSFGGRPNREIGGAARPYWRIYARTVTADLFFLLGRVLWNYSVVLFLIFYTWYCTWRPLQNATSLPSARDMQQRKP